MGRDFWEYFDLSLAGGAEPKKEREGNITELYVGYELRNVYPVGSEFELFNSKGEITGVCRISGVLNAGSRVMAPEAAVGEEIGAYNTDYMVLWIEHPDTFFVNGEFFVITDSPEDMKTVQRKLIEIGEKYHVTAMVNTLENVFAQSEREIHADYGQMQYAVFLLAVTAVILLLVSQVMEQMDFSEVYGVWYANGASKKDMRRTLFYQNLLRLIPAEIFAGAGMYYVAWYIYQKYQQGYHHRVVMQQIFFHWMLPGILLAGVLIVAAAVLVPLFILNRRNAVELLNRRASEGRTCRRFSKVVRDGRMSGLLILEILLVLLLFTNAAMYFHSYQYAGETVTLNGSYKNQQTLGIDVDWQANIGEDGWTPQIQESTIDELLEFCRSVKDLPVSVILYRNWMISMPPEYASTGLLLTDSEPPQRLSEGKYEPDRQGIYLSEALVPLLETDETGAYLESFHTRFPLLGTVAARGQETEDSMYVYFQTLEEATQREILTEMVRMCIDASYFEPLALVVGSNDAEIGDTVEAVQAALSSKTMISCKELETEEAIAAISGNQDIMQDQALFRLLVIGIVMFFCMVSLLQVLSLWMERKREEITIRWAVGMKKRQILGALMQEMLCLMGVCLLFGGFVELAVCWGVKRYSFLVAAGYLAAASVGTFLVFSALLVHVFRKSTRSMELAVLLRE
ncbi:MAG: ABC transporter permease [Lachnospiraceae bacterium]|nr:ABC transporter permease [Lachnospiraceae bacterium]